MTVCKGGIFKDEGIGPHILGNAEAFYQLGFGGVASVHRKKALVQQRKQRAVCKIRAEKGVHGATRVVGQLQRLILQIRGVAGRGGVVLLKGQDVAGGGIGFGLRAAAPQRQQAEGQ